MGECLSWAVGRLLPSLWEAEVVFSAAALLAGALFLFLLFDHHAAPSKAKSSSSSSSSASTGSAPSSLAATRRRGWSGYARGKAAADEIVPCSPITGGQLIKVRRVFTLLHHHQQSEKKAGTTPMATQLDLARVWADFSLLFL
jgi:hypothetical protein